jgi:cell wall-associated NlpC family hydrolase
MNHWAIQYLNKPWVSGGVGPDEFDCWGFVRYLKRQREGIELPVIAVDGNDPRAVLKAFRQHPELQRYAVHETRRCSADEAQQAPNPLWSLD